MIHVRLDVPPVPEALEAVGEGLVRLNVWLFGFADANDAPAPLLYESGVVYRREPAGQEWWQSSLDVVGVATKRSGDCEDLAAYRAGELRYIYDEQANLKVIVNSRGNFHAVVERGDGTIEDPSQICLKLERERKQGARR